MPTEPAPPTVIEVIRRAVEVCDPKGADPALAELLERFEDHDEPIAGLADPEAELAEAATLDDEVASPAERMVVAVATYLAHRRDELHDDRESLLRLTARAEFDGRPPAEISAWLEEQGIPATP